MNLRGMSKNILIDKLLKNEPGRFVCPALDVVISGKNLRTTTYSSNDFGSVKYSKDRRGIMLSGLFSLIWHPV